MKHRSHRVTILLTLALLVVLVPSPMIGSAAAAARPDPNAEDCGGEWTPLQPGVGLCHDDFGEWECYSLWAYGRNVSNYLCIVY